MLLLPLHVDIDIFLRNENKMKHVLRSLNGRNTELKLSQPKEDYDVMKKRNIIKFFCSKNTSPAKVTPDIFLGKSNKGKHLLRSLSRMNTKAC